MDDAVNKAIEKPGVVDDFEYISIDERAFAGGHDYAMTTKEYDMAFDEFF